MSCDMYCMFTTPVNYVNYRYDSLYHVQRIRAYSLVTSYFVRILRINSYWYVQCTLMYLSCVCDYPYYAPYTNTKKHDSCVCVYVTV